MPFNLQVFKTRALTAIIFAAVMLAGLLVNHWTFLLLFTVIHFGCWVEYQKLIGLIDPNYKDITPFHKYGVMLLGYGFMLWILNKAYAVGNIQLHAVGWWLVLIVAIALPVTEVLFGKKGGIKNAGYSLLGLLYISLSWGLMMDIRNDGISLAYTTNADTGIATISSGWDFGQVFPIVLIASIWINDTMAYIVGSFIGKTPFSKISPKKTWEGTIGGALLAIVVVSTVCYFTGINLKAAIGISAIAAIIGTAGDLLESKLKRLANVKDSGSIMPGHGGFLDRFDSLLLATPFVWLYLKLFL